MNYVGLRPRRIEYGVPRITPRITRITGKDNEMRAKYDFTGGVRGKHYAAMHAGYTITTHNADGTTVVKDVMPKKGSVALDPDILAYFPDSGSVNRALRCLIPLLPKKHRAKPKRA